MFKTSFVVLPIGRMIVALKPKGIAPLVTTSFALTMTAYFPGLGVGKVIGSVL